MPKKSSNQNSDESACISDEDQVNDYPGLKDEITQLRDEVRKQRLLVDELKEELASYEILLEDKNMYINDIQSEIRKAEKKLERDYNKYDKMIKDHLSVEKNLICDVEALKNKMYYRTYVTVVVVSLLILIAIV